MSSHRKLRFARLRRGVRQYALADALGIAPQRLAEIEAGRRPLKPDLYRQALDILRKQPIKEVENHGKTN